VIEIICEAIKKGEIKYPSHLHVRFHPRDNFERHEKLKKYGDIISFEKPGKSATQEKYEWNPDEKDMLHFANLLHHSDVAVNVCSTVTIDAAAFGTPVINVAFDGYERKPYWDSVVRYYDYTHYLDIVKTGGAKIAKNKDELIDYINEYLKNPNLDGSGRKRIVEEMCYKLDGKSGERITRYILNFLNESGRIK
jgi:CDP-glycerol glycerophosphotransferase (TagB/SpsB family)